MLESKRVAVLFSGGLDSTYLIWKNLKDGNEVYPIYIEIENNERKVLLEKNRIELLCKKFKEEYGDKMHSIKYVLKIFVQDTYNSGLHLNQLPIWIIGLQWLQNLDVSEFQFGYVMNDDAISYIDDIKNIHKSFSGVHDRMVELSFPLIKEKKVLMARELPSKYFELVVSCESPKIIDDKKEIIEYEPCCSCPACERLISEYYDLIVDKTKYEKNLKYNLLNKVSQYADSNGVINIYKHYLPTETLSINKQLEFDFPE